MSNRLDGFNRIAPVYNWLTRIVFGDKIISAQLCFLNEIKNANHILVLGGGSGEWLSRIQAENPRSIIWYIEASSKMISLAKKNVYDSKRINFIHGTHSDVPDGVVFDVVVTFFFLDMFNSKELNKLVRILTGVCQENAKWLICDFVNDQAWHAALLKLMYLFFRITAGVQLMSLHNWRSILDANGLTKIAENHFYGRFIYSCIYKFGLIK